MLCYKRLYREILFMANLSRIPEATKWLVAGQYLFNSSATLTVQDYLFDASSLLALTACDYIGVKSSASARMNIGGDSSPDPDTVGFVTPINTVCFTGGSFFEVYYFAQTVAKTSQMTTRSGKIVCPAASTLVYFTFYKRP